MHTSILEYVAKLGLWITCSTIAINSLFTNKKKPVTAAISQPSGGFT
jgi:hypothetical protein